MVTLQLACPACGDVLRPSHLRQMNGFWGLRAVPCGGCGAVLHYHPQLRRRLRIGGRVFRVGVSLVVAWLILHWLGAVSPVLATVLGWTAISTVAAGIFVTATPPGSIRLEVVEGVSSVNAP